MTDPALTPAAAHPAPPSVKLGAKPKARVAPTDPKRPDPPVQRPDALRAILVDPGPGSPSRRTGWRSGLWLSAAVAVMLLADGAGLVWFQPTQTPTPVIPDLAPPSRSPALEQASAPDQPASSLPVPESSAPGLEPVAVTPEPTADSLMQQALEIEAHDPAQAAVAYARAAIRGRARAAYYLGQLYETGTGVEPSPGLARLWYAAAAGLPAAQRRLRAFPVADAPPVPLAAPVPIFHARLRIGGSEMIWRLSGDVAPARFRVEMFGAAEERLAVQQTTVPGLIVPFPVSAWRVIAIDADGTESAPSATVRMIPAQ